MAAPEIEFAFDAKDLARIKAAIEELPRGPARTAVNKATREAAKPVRKLVQDTAPRDTGAMADETHLKNFRAKARNAGAFVATPTREKLAGEHTNKKGNKTKRQQRIRAKRGDDKAQQILRDAYYYPAVQEKKTRYMRNALDRMSGSVRSALSGLFLKHFDAAVAKYRAKKGLK